MIFRVALDQFTIEGFGPLECGLGVDRTADSLVKNPPGVFSTRAMPAR